MDFLLTVYNGIHSILWIILIQVIENNSEQFMKNISPRKNMYFLAVFR